MPMRYRSIYLTGASRGLGAALAIAYASPGRHLGLVARGAEDLRRVADACRARGAIVVEGCLDICDAEGQQRFLKTLERHGPLDLAICNAGMFAGRPRGSLFEPLAVARSLIETNLTGTIVTAQTVVTVLAAQRRGRIALVSSLAAPHPAADAAAYSASKAGVSAYGDALRELLAPDIGVTVVLPGHIATRQTEVHQGALPLLLSPEAAARRVMTGLERQADVIVFPKRLHWLGLAGRVLPKTLRWRLNASMRFNVREDADAG